MGTQCCELVLGELLFVLALVYGIYLRIEYHTVTWIVFRWRCFYGDYVGTLGSEWYLPYASGFILSASTDDFAFVFNLYSMLVEIDYAPCIAQFADCYQVV